MISEFIKAFIFIFIAEMGDKTQILAMTFATQYNAKKVLLGVFLGSLINHGLAILLGSYLSSFVPLNAIQIIAGFAFVGFGLWALKLDEDDENSNQNNFGPVLTVALAFFIGELGDKTQLTAMTLSTDAQFPIFILLGTVSGMIMTSGVGIFVGRKIGEKVPEIAIKLISSGVFIFFGILKLVQTVPSKYLTVINIILFIIILSAIVFLLLSRIVKEIGKQQKTLLQESAVTLYIQKHDIKEAIENVCLGDKNCGGCKGSNCLVDYAKSVLDTTEKNSEHAHIFDVSKLPERDNDKAYNENSIVEALGMTIFHLISYHHTDEERAAIDKVRGALEKIAFGEPIPFENDIKKYFYEIQKRDKRIMKKIRSCIEEMKKQQRKRE